jgi:hypothetical protein
MTTTTAIAFTILVLVGAVPLVFAWMRAATPATDFSSSITRPVLTVVTLSFVVLLAGLVWRPLLGADYTSRRYATIYLNLALMLICAIVAVVRGRQHRAAVAASAAIIALEWLYLAVVSSVV